MGPIDTSTNIQGTISTAVAGVYKRTKTFVWTTAQENYDHYGWVFAGSTGFVYGGYLYVLTNPVKITKSSVNKLTLNLDVTWGRAV